LFLIFFIGCANLDNPGKETLRPPGFALLILGLGGYDPQPLGMRASLKDEP